MFNDVLVNLTCVIAISMFSLAWFIVGLSAGKHLAPIKKRPARARKSRDGKQSKVELYVGNLSYDTKSKELRSAFEEYGKVRNVRIIENKFTGKSKGFAFVEMAVRADALAAIKKMNGSELSGRKLVVNEARTRPKKE